MGFFKSSDELFDKAQDLVNQREFDKAVSTFQKSAEKANKNGQKDIFIMSNALASILSLHGLESNPQAYIDVVQNLTPLGENEVKIGIKSVIASVLAIECQITAQDLNLRNTKQSDHNLLERATKLEELGIAYQTKIGTNALFVPEFFMNKTATGMQRSMMLFAESNECKAEAMVWSDPKKAAEFYLNAVQYRKQANDPGSESADMDKVRQYSKSASCWFCGREIEGENVHFFKLDASLTPLLRQVKNESPLPCMDESQNAIYACRGCSSAVQKIADKIALDYYNKAMAKLTEVNNHLQNQINSLQNQINNLARYSHHH